MEWGNLRLTLQLVLQLCWLAGMIDGNIPVHKCVGDSQQLKHRPDCVCNSVAIVDYFSEILHIGSIPRDKVSQMMLARIPLFPCYEFLQLPGHLQIEMTDSVISPLYKRRRKVQRHRKRYRTKRDLSVPSQDQHHHRAKRQISLGFPSPIQWEKAIPHLPKRGRHYYTPVGLGETLKCYAGHDGTDQSGIIDKVDDVSRKFEWKHANGMEITAPLTTIDPNTGDLTFAAVRLADTGIYNCTFSSEGGGRSRTFQSQLDVVAGQTHWLRFGMTYKVSGCHHKELLEIQHNLPNLVHKYVCHFCSVRNVSMTCIGLGKGGGDGKIVQLTVGLSAIGLEDFLPNWKHNYINCDLECQKSMHAEVLKMAMVSLVKLFSLPIHVLHVGKEGPTIYTAIPDSYDEDLAEGCPPGFFLDYSLCFPCAPGKYSPTGPEDCFRCPKGYFQPNPGSSACFHCPEKHTTSRKGSRSQMDCILETASSWLDFFHGHFLIFAWIGIFILLLILLIILTLCCCPNSWLGRIVKCQVCCGGEGCCGCCGGEGVEKEIPDDQDKLLMNEGTSTTDFDSDASSSTNEELIRKRKRQSRSSRYRDDDGDDLRSSEESKNATQTDNNKNVTLSIVREDTTIEKRSSLSTPKCLDLTKVAVKQPIVPYPFRRGRCQATLRSLRQQKREQLEEEQQQTQLENRPEESSDQEAPAPTPPPPLPPSTDDDDDNGDNGAGDGDVNYQSETSESSATKRFFTRNPHLKLGNVLRKSKSLMAKLAEQRRKLRHRSPSKLASSAAESLSTLKNKIRNKMVKISESNNTYHHPDPDPPCNQCSSQVFKKKGKKKRKEEEDDEQFLESRNSRSNNKISSRSSSKLDRFREKSSERVKSAVKKIQSKVRGKKKKNDNLG